MTACHSGRTPLTRPLPPVTVAADPRARLPVRIARRHGPEHPPHCRAAAPPGSVGNRAPGPPRDGRQHRARRQAAGRRDAETQRRPARPGKGAAHTGPPARAGPGGPGGLAVPGVPRRKSGRKAPQSPEAPKRGGNGATGAPARVRSRPHPEPRNHSGGVQYGRARPSGTPIRRQPARSRALKSGRVARPSRPPATDWRPTGDRPKRNAALRRHMPMNRLPWARGRKMLHGHALHRTGPRATTGDAVPIT